MSVTYGTRVCDSCGAEFVARSSTSKRCSSECARRRKSEWSAAHYVANRAEILERGREYAARNPDKARARSRRYESAHRESRRGRPRDAVQQAEYWQRYYAENGARLRASSTRWARENADRRAEMTRRRRARTRGAHAYRVTNADLDRALRRARWACTYCKAAVAQVHWDHVVPLARGGGHSIGNLAPTCAACNQQKHAKTVMEWRVWRMRLGMPALA